LPIAGRERPLHDEEHVGVVRQRERQDHARRPVDRGQRHPGRLGDELRDRAVPAVQRSRPPSARRLPAIASWHARLEQLDSWRNPFDGLDAPELPAASASRGVISDREARQRNLGGEVLCEVW